MPKLIFIALFSLIILPAFADETQTRIDVNPKVYPPKAFAGKAKVVRPMKSAEESLPDKEKRDAIFAKVPGLDKYVESFDHLDKDLLLMRAKSQTHANLKQKYPAIPAEILTQLQKAAKGKK